jgi:hypothetical protein
MPTASDLVTDLPADFETFGQAVATSMADLLGGTTGQVLSKASNTDMDFTWVTSDDANAIQNAIVDAKGDLIAASAADTPARLAVGTNFGFLQADSSTATGLLWNNATWTAYTPTVTANAGSGFTMSGAGNYTRIGKLCVFNFSATITTNGTGAGSIIVTLPFTRVNRGAYAAGQFRDNTVTGLTGNLFLNTTTTASLTFDNNVYPGANGVILAGTVTYEVE